MFPVQSENCFSYQIIAWQQTGRENSSTWASSCNLYKHLQLWLELAVVVRADGWLAFRLYLPLVKVTDKETRDEAIAEPTIPTGPLLTKKLMSNSFLRQGLPSGVYGTLRRRVKCHRPGRSWWEKLNSTIGYNWLSQPCSQKSVIWRGINWGHKNPYMSWTAIHFHPSWKIPLPFLLKDWEDIHQNSCL